MKWILFYMIVVHQSEFSRNLFSATLNDLREGANLSCSDYYYWQIIIAAVNVKEHEKQS